MSTASALSPNSSSPARQRATLAQQTRSQLSELGWSQAKLAGKLGVTPNTVSRWLTGQLAVPMWLTEYLRALLAVKRLTAELDLG